MVVARRLWSELPEGVLGLISSKLTDSISDYLRFRAVCPPWRRAALLSDLPQQFPWLMLSYKENRTTRSFCTNANNSRKRSIVTIDLPEGTRRTCGSSHGWLALLDKTRLLSLFNPVTRARIQLPPPTDLILKNVYSGMVSLSSSSSSADCMVFIIKFRYPELAFCRLGDGAWTVPDTAAVPRARGIASISYHKGLFYIVDDEGNGCVLTEAGCNAAVIPPPHPCTTYHPVAPYHLVTYKEQILLVAKYLSAESEDDEYSHISEELCDVFRLVQEEKWGSSSSIRELKWSRVADMDDCALFLSHHYCWAICAGGSSGCRQGCIYLSEPHLVYRKPRNRNDSIKYRKGKHSVEVFGIKEKHFEQIDGEEFGMWKLGLESDWFTPRLC